MAMMIKDKTVKKTFIVCDRCKKEVPYQRTLSDTLELLVKHKWMPVSGTSDGMLCSDCVSAILTEWYNKNKPENINTPLFNDKPDVYAALNVANHSSDSEGENLSDEVLNSLPEELFPDETNPEPVSANIWNNDDIPF